MAKRTTKASKAIEESTEIQPITSTPNANEIKSDIQKDNQKLAVLCAQLADDKLAKDVIVLDLQKIEVAQTDFFVLASCESTSQVRAISDIIQRQAKNYRLAKPKVEGETESEWILIDFFDVVVHIMTTQNRQFYRIEKLWADADFYKVNNDGDLILEDTKEVIKLISEA